MIKIREYINTDGKSSFAKWFDGLNAQAAAKVTTYLTRIENGNTSQIKGIGSGVLECRIDYGPGYRIYFARDGENLIILLCGGTKKQQQGDIDKAHKLWQEYKTQKGKLWH